MLFLDVVLVVFSVLFSVLFLAWPGMGRMAVYAITMRDYPLIEGFVLWISIVYTVINFLVDLSYTYLDPRLKKGDSR